jgi:2-keto-4-pentenoate hydratase/2-oxohepta-3-ene-1,7-dioic acid hydratase in catechol pathway
MDLLITYFHLIFLTNRILSLSFVMNKVLQKTKKIICLLRNYEEHAKEMKSVVPKNCNFFLKPTTSILYSENKNETLNIEIPKDCELDHEGIFIS